MPQTVEYGAVMLVTNAPHGRLVTDSGNAGVPARRAPSRHGLIGPLRLRGTTVVTADSDALEPWLAQKQSFAAGHFTFERLRHFLTLIYSVCSMKTW